MVVTGRTVKRQHEGVGLCVAALEKAENEEKSRREQQPEHCGVALVCHVWRFLHSPNKLHDFPVVVLDRCHRQQIPKRRAILLVVEQSPAPALASNQRLLQLGHLSAVRVLPLKESAGE